MDKCGRARWWFAKLSKTLALGVIGGAVCVTCMAILVFTPPVDLATLKRVTTGMTRTEGEALLGSPTDVRPFGKAGGKVLRYGKWWAFGSAYLEIDAANKVVRAEYDN